MKVKDVICEALRLVGRNDAADKICGGDTLTDEVARLNRACLTYLNAVVDELARGYFSPEVQRAAESDDGVIPLADLGCAPADIKCVKAGGRAVKWHICEGYLHTRSGKVEITCAFRPAPFEAEDEFCFPDPCVSERIVQYGIAAEYFLVLGDEACSSAWEDKYRESIDIALGRSAVRGHIPPRRWI